MGDQNDRRGLPQGARVATPVRHEAAIDSLRDDDYLGAVLERHGPVTLEPAEDTFQRLVTSLIRQQVSMEAAAAIRERVFDRVEVTPAGVRSADEALLRNAGLSAAKVEYVRAAARAFEEQDWSRSSLAELDDTTVMAELTDIRGVGPWTAKMFLMFCLGRPDVFPVEDLGIRKGVESVAGSDLSRSAMRDLAAAEWAPYRSYASLYLWRHVEAE